MTPTKQLILPYEIVQMLRGERGYTAESKDLAELARDSYQDGKAGHPHVRIDSYGFPPHIVEAFERFLLACWEQGRKDAGEAGA